MEWKFPMKYIRWTTSETTNFMSNHLRRRLQLPNNKSSELYEYA